MDTEERTSTFNKWDWEESAQRRREWQSRFTMCWNFQWHTAEDGCDCVRQAGGR